MATPACGDPRIAYLTSQYPATSHTFISREVAALRKLGVSLDTFSIRPPSPAELQDEAIAAEARNTFTVLKQPATINSRCAFGDALQQSGRISPHSRACLEPSSAGTARLRTFARAFRRGGGPRPGAPAAADHAAAQSFRQFRRNRRLSRDPPAQDAVELHYARHLGNRLSGGAAARAQDRGR